MSGSKTERPSGNTWDEKLYQRVLNEREIRYRQFAEIGKGLPRAVGASAARRSVRVDRPPSRVVRALSARRVRVGEVINILMHVLRTVDYDLAVDFYK